MYFVSGLPLTLTMKDPVWVIVDQCLKSAHFFAVCMNYLLQKLVERYIVKIVQLHGVPISIIFYRDPHFTSRFLKSLQEALGSKLSFNTVIILRPMVCQ